MARPDIAFAQEVLAKLAEPSIEERVRNGQRLRAKIVDALDGGEAPEGYRWDWINNQTAVLLELLQMIADDFNKKHPEDYCTALDLLDILSLADGRIRKQFGLQKK